MTNSVQSLSKRVCLSNDEEGQNDIDRISDLPDSVLCHILSFLPTKMSVATSILSKRWVNLWSVVPVLSFSYVELPGRFVDSVYNVFTMCRTQTIHRFSLDFKPKSKVDGEHLEAWINAAIGRNIQELKLSLRDPLETFIRLPDNMFSCKTLVSLELLEDVFVDRANVCFPSLKILRLERVCYANDKSLSRLLSGCPVLEDLVLERTLDYNMLSLDINLPSLKKFTVKKTLSDVCLCEILINAPLLERIELLDTSCFVSQVEDLPNLVEATILLDICNNEVAKLIKVMYNAKFLSLSEEFFMELCCLTCWDNVLLELPVYHNLVYLEITTGCVHWVGLEAVLRCSDNLKALVVHIKVPLYHMGRKCDQSLPESVPKCVSMSLKTLKLTGFCDQHCNWKLARYILRNAKFLKKMKIGTSLRLMKQRHRLKNLLKYPRASMSCEIGFFIDASGKEIHL